jgi:hypothetical protein
MSLDSDSSNQRDQRDYSNQLDHPKNSKSDETPATVVGAVNNVVCAVSKLIVDSVNTPFIKFLTAFTLNYVAVSGVVYLVKKMP